MFIKGDIVKCISKEARNSKLIIGETYLVLEVYTSTIRLENGQYFHSRFVLDIKGTRKRKLQKCLR